MTVTIEKPEHGWSSIKIEDSTQSFEGSLSYVDAVLDNFLDAFIVYLENRVPVAIECDEEGTEFTILIFHNCIRVMIDREETSVRTFFFFFLEFIKGVCLEFIKNLDAWLEFDCITQDDLIQVHLHQQRKAKYLLKFSKIEKLIEEWKN